MAVGVGDGVFVGTLVLVAVEADVGVLVGVNVAVADPDAEVGVKVGVLVGAETDVTVKQAASNSKVPNPLFHASTRTFAVPLGAVPCRVYCFTRGGV